MYALLLTAHVSLLCFFRLWEIPCDIHDVDQGPRIVIALLDHFESHLFHRKQFYVVTINAPSKCRPTTDIASAQVPNAQTYAAVSRQPSCSSTAPSDMFMYTDIWTDTSNGSNSR
jgi:hypothetical protein